MKPCDHDVPFFANPDATHCYQAALRMVLKRFRPERDYSWQMLDHVTGKVEGLGTWPFAGLSWMHDQRFAITNVELMDNRRFAAEGRAYLAELAGAEFAESVDAGVDLSRVQQEAAVFVDKVRCEMRMPTIDDACRLVEAGKLVVCNVNSRVLNGREGYSGHFVVVKGFADDELIVHDPGPPGTANRKVTFEAFERAWAYPNSTAKTLVAIDDVAPM